MPPRRFFSHWLGDLTSARYSLASWWFWGAVLLLSRTAQAAPTWEIVSSPSDNADCITLAGDQHAAAVVVDADDYPVVQLAANLFADDVQRVTGHRPVVGHAPANAVQMVIAGTLGHSKLIDRLNAEGRLKKVDEIKGRWEATAWQIVPSPFPGVERALVIVGSDRRGTAYGLMQLSEKIGVSPWNWWADVPTPHRDTLAIKNSSPQTDTAAVKYRGIFINDEDWGLFPWAKNTFDPELKNIGPKTYAKVFELMLRLRLNYIWPAMHEVSLEFGSLPENVKLADQYAIVAGASHCEQMLCNNVHWKPKEKGEWNYATNRDAIHAYWEDSVKARATEEAVWTLGIRGIHDQAMQGDKSMSSRIGVVAQAIKDQRAMLDQFASKEWGPVAQCFIPYKEVQPIYDAGLEVPPDVTLVWADDNYGYMRRFSSPVERKRPGGSGFYYHLSYYGRPQSYVWINTRAPAFEWLEMHKAWENQARTIWMLNVGDIKPMEIGIDYFARLAWNPEGFGPNSQPPFLREFAAKNFGEKVAQPVADFLAEYYRLGTIRKPELMTREWATTIPAEQAAQLEREYRNLLDREKSLAATIPAEARDAYTETVGFPARVVGTAGLIFLADRKVQMGEEVAANGDEISRLRDDLSARAKDFNTGIANGKWNGVILNAVTAKQNANWSSHMRWPWNEKPGPLAASTAQAIQLPAGQTWRDAAASHQSAPNGARWSVVTGLGQTNRAVALEPTTLETSWKPEGDPKAPTLEYDFEAKGGDAEAVIDFLPTYRLYPGMKLRVAVSVDSQPSVSVEVPGSGGEEDENGPVRRFAVQDSYARVQVPLAGLSAGKHTFKIRAVDPGAVVDRVSLP